MSIGFLVFVLTLVGQVSEPQHPIVYVKGIATYEASVTITGLPEPEGELLFGYFEHGLGTGGCKVVNGTCAIYLKASPSHPDHLYKLVLRRTTDNSLVTAVDWYSE